LGDFGVKRDPCEYNVLRAIIEEKVINCTEKAFMVTIFILSGMEIGRYEDKEGGEERYFCLTQKALPFYLLLR
jgi:hypothetical protein